MRKWARNFGIKTKFVWRSLALGSLEWLVRTFQYTYTIAELLLRKRCRYIGRIITAWSNSAITYIFDNIFDKLFVLVCPKVTSKLQRIIISFLADGTGIFHNLHHNYFCKQTRLQQGTLCYVMRLSQIPKTSV
jgi:hypothetical protein